VSAKSWYFVTTAYIVGKTLEKNASEFISQEGGRQF
jgi:branched-chain amino acid transport system substrate-binding protein